MDPPSDWMSQGTMMLTLLGASWTTGTLRSPIHMVTLPSHALSGGVPLITESDRPDPVSVRVSPGTTYPPKGSRYGVCPMSSICEPSSALILRRRPVPVTAKTVLPSPEIVAVVIRSEEHTSELQSRQ